MAVSVGITRFYRYLYPSMQEVTDYKKLYEDQSAEVAELRSKLTSLSHQIQELQRLIFGSKTEKFVPFLLLRVAH